nr:enamine deaminase RidA [Candidatus Pantoea persica]
MATVKSINYSELGPVTAPYVHAVKHADTLYISGLTAFGTAAQQGKYCRAGGGDISAAAEDRHGGKDLTCLPAESDNIHYRL